MYKLSNIVTCKVLVFNYAISERLIFFIKLSTSTQGREGEQHAFRHVQTQAIFDRFI